MTVSIRPTLASLVRLALPIAVVAGSLALAGCGRKAEPEMPTVDGVKPTPRPVGIPIAPTTPAPSVKPEKKSLPLDVLL